MNKGKKITHSFSIKKLIVRDLNFKKLFFLPNINIFVQLYSFIFINLYNRATNLFTALRVVQKSVI
jgi:hypothetical protein